MSKTNQNEENPSGIRGAMVTAMSYIAERAGLSEAMGKQFSGKRDIYEALGYKKNPSFDDFFSRYERQDVAGRVVDMPPAATWRNFALVKEDDDINNLTEFEKAWIKLCRYKKIGHYLERVDRISGIGRYAVLLLGVKDGKTLDQELVAGSLKGPDDILYLAPYSEKNAPVTQWVTDSKDARFGKPLFYTINFGNTGTTGTTGLRTQKVHYSRVIHIAEGLTEDEVYGRPRLKRILNLLDDLAKIVGGSGEMFWQGAYRGLHADLRDGYNFGEGEAQKVTEEMDEYIHGLRRYIRTKGMDVKSLAGEVASPQYHFEMMITLVAGATGIPKRILTGAERGELASGQDETNWNAYVKERQTQYAEPQILRPFIDKLIELGALPEPKEDYKVEWPNLFETSDKEKADIANTKAQAIKNYAPFGDTTSVMPVEEFRETILGVDAEIPEKYRKKMEEDEDLNNLDNLPLNIPPRNIVGQTDPVIPIEEGADENA